MCRDHAPRYALLHPTTSTTHLHSFFQLLLLTGSQYVATCACLQIPFLHQQQKIFQSVLSSIFLPSLFSDYSRPSFVHTSSRHAASSYSLQDIGDIAVKNLQVSHIGYHGLGMVFNLRDAHMLYTTTQGSFSPFEML